MGADGSSVALVLVDLQHDYLDRPGLQPPAPVVVSAASALLDGFRARDLPVAHVRTVAKADGSDRMPHWKRDDLEICVEGTHGVEAPAVLAARPGELIATKRFFSGFADPELDPWLRAAGVERVVVAGVLTHACVRHTAVDAYERGYEVVVVTDAVASTEPVHAAATLAWLEGRVARGASTAELRAEIGALGGSGDASSGTGPVLPVAVIDGHRVEATHQRRVVHADPCRTDVVVSEVPVGGPEEVREAARVVADARRTWAALPPETRADALDRWGDVLDARKAELAAAIASEVGKPAGAAADEVRRAVAHVRSATALLRGPLGSSRLLAEGVTVRQVPVGVVGVLMPWNNPVALPCGAISSALAFGNGVVFKPAPEGSATALRLVDSLVAAGIPAGLVGLVMGDGDTGTAMADEPLVDALVVTGSIATGRALAARCGAAAKPLRAELGGNNAAVVLADADLDAVVPPLVRAAYSYSGQRCTGIRRFVVEAPVFDDFLERAAAVVDSLTVGDPADATIDLGPLISIRHRDRVGAVVARAVAEGATLVRGGSVPDGLAHGAWFAPTLLVVADPHAAVVVEETFGPVVVVQAAADIDDAIALANGVPQGLVMTVCTRDPDARARIEAAADVGILQLGAGAVPIHADAPFGGRKASGIGPPEHGEWDAQFFSVPQVVYADG